MTEVLIEEYCDGFSVTVDGTRKYFSQEGSVEELVECFEQVAEADEVSVTFESVY